jgi:hypothetical protein
MFIAVVIKLLVATSRVAVSHGSAVGVFHVIAPRSSAYASWQMNDLCVTCTESFEKKS